MERFDLVVFKNPPHTDNDSKEAVFVVEAVDNFGQAAIRHDNGRLYLTRQKQFIVKGERCMDPNVKKQIDAMTYEQMLRKWRHTKCSSDSIFHGESGVYFREVMNEKEKALDPGEKVEISKRIGW